MLVQWTTPRTLDNFEDEVLHETETYYPKTNSNLVRAQQTATHGLEALSAAAADYTSHVTPGYPGSYGINSAAGTTDAIDPSLDARRGSLDAASNPGPDGSPVIHGDTADEQLAHALRLHTEQAADVRTERIEKEI